MTVPFDYEANPERYRLGMRLTRQHLRASRDLCARVAGVLVGAGARLVLDIGCGEGALRAALPGPPPHVVGLDLSTTMLRAHPRPAVRADAAVLPFTNDIFDAVVAANMLYHLAGPTVAIREAHRVLAVGGLFAAATISRRDSPELAHVW